MFWGRFLSQKLMDGWIDKQCVENRVQKIRAHLEITWRYVPTQGKPASLASRGILHMIS